MKKLRLLAAGLPLGALAILAVAGAPAASAATHPATHVTVYAGQDMISPNTFIACPGTLDEVGPAHTYHVDANNISIRNAPDGKTILWAISNTAAFESSFQDSFGFYDRCVSSVITGPPDSGIQWVLGWSVAHTGHEGWVGLKYLKW
jgi:hypothetical protein